MENLYAILGIEINSNDKQVKSAYRKLAKKLHPDLNPGDIEGEERFKKIVNAYEILSDPDKKKAYDQKLKEEAERIIRMRRAKSQRASFFKEPSNVVGFAVIIAIIVIILVRVGALSLDSGKNTGTIN